MRENFSPIERKENNEIREYLQKKYFIRKQATIIAIKR